MAAVGRRDSFLNNIIPQCAFLLIIMMSASSSKAITNVLTSGQTLGSNDKLGYPNSEVSLSWSSCNLVLNDDKGVARWESGTGKWFYFGCTLSLNENGRLVLTGFYHDQLWISDNANAAAGKYVAVLRPDATLFIYNPAIWTVGVLTVKESSIGISSNNSDNNNNEMVSSMTNLKNAPAIHNALFSGDILPNGGNISENGYTFILDDCELIFKDSHGNIFWRTFTRGDSRNCYARLDYHGGLAIFGDPGLPLLWTNEKQLAHPPPFGEYPFGEYALVIQSNGTANIYGPDVWSRPAFLSTVVIPRDGHIKMPTVKM